MSGSNDRWSEAARRARDLSYNGLGAVWWLTENGTGPACTK
jgi:hypothetical protein